MGGENMNSLTKAQQKLVAQNLPVVHWVICDYIHVNPTICGLEYSDLFQEGCLWLCKAAATYKDDGRAQFSTYAKTVVKNGLLSYCRKVCNHRSHFSRNRADRDSCNVIKKIQLRNLLVSNEFCY